MAEGRSVSLLRNPTDGTLDPESTLNCGGFPGWNRDCRTRIAFDRANTAAGILAIPAVAINETL